MVSSTEIKAILITILVICGFVFIIKPTKLNYFCNIEKTIIKLSI